MTTKYRARQIETWDGLAGEKESDGTPKYKNAKSNSDYWRETDMMLEAIREKLDRA